MLEEGNDCDKIITQFQAAKAALDSAFSEMLNDNLDHCLAKKDKAQLKKIVKLITKK
jgi:DNA-binding FrmR family transcriptional regulator